MVILCVVDTVIHFPNYIYLDAASGHLVSLCTEWKRIMNQYSDSELSLLGFITGSKIYINNDSP